MIGMIDPRYDTVEVEYRQPGYLPRETRGFPSPPLDGFGFFSIRNLI